MVNDIIKAAAILASLNYLANPNHGKRYYFPMTVACGAGIHGANRKLAIACIERDTLIEVIRNERALETGFLKVSDNVLKVNKISESAFRKTFGNRISVRYLEQNFKTYSELPLDASPCAGPRARTFEKLVCKTIGAKWCGGLNRVQIDGVTIVTDAEGNEVKIYDEVKGLGGRITAFVPSEIDKDKKE